ncbi:exodeoxyribonuclease V subunit beta [Buchnera aphidicola]|uniref:exodeoxyribonuclease V subunit beta n=1 Tax=Buchnera aphidicola TaxID=9 RepID=UPI00094C9770|nr:exodeoxyribonuclease V subunit beta [Buchnera aphidicola]
MEYIPFNMQKIPNHGITLVEASAGTGKTFAIIILYLRLLLNVGIKNTYSKPLSINEILVVTFTEASKNELKKRLYKKIYQLFHMHINGMDSDNADLQKIIKDIKNPKSVTKILKKAKKNIDCIMIYTLHSFFRHILLEQRFLCSQVIPKKMLPDIEEIQLEATKDFWRKTIYPANKEIVALILKKWKNPQALFKHIFTWINQVNLNFTHNFSKTTNLNKKYDKIISIINKTKNIWNEKKKEIQKLIQKIQLNKNIYNKKNIKRWYTEISIWAKKNTKKCFFPKILKYFQIREIKKDYSQKNKIKYLFFIYVEKIFTYYNIFFEYFIYLSLKNIQNITKRKKKEKNGLEFNDLNTILWKQINRKKSIIKKNILKKYTITIIDECQDIDSIQFNIFYRLYNNSYNKSLILIGDPKQSIYGFRGANIASYLKLKKKIKKCFFLERNFRSSENIVKGINIIFSRLKQPFILKDIPFQPSKVHSGNKKIKFVVDNKTQPAFKFFYKKKTTITVPEYYLWISRQCAYSIGQWLSHQSTKKSFIILKNKKKRHIQPQDIAILVKNKHEAHIIAQELKKQNIPTIYTSQKKNIFNTVEAREIMWILDSVLDISNESKFQKLLVTKIFTKSIYDIYSIKNKQKLYFYLLKRLKKYYSIWSNSNVSKMIEEIINDFKIPFLYQNAPRNSPNLDNILNISTILEKKNNIITNKFLLNIWFKEKISQNKKKDDDKYNRQQIDQPINQDCVTITTIHMSKGLEYPIIWIPFISHSQNKNNQIFFCKKKDKKIIDLKNKIKNQILSQLEASSENMRLLYVSLTRSIVHCSIGIAILKKKSNNAYTAKLPHLYINSLHFLILNKKKDDEKNLIQELDSMQEKNIIQIQKGCQIKRKIYQNRKIKKTITVISKMLYTEKYPWIKVNFSKIMKYNVSHKPKCLFKKLDHIEKTLCEKYTSSIQTHIHALPKGKEFGIYLHDILKKIQFSNIRAIKEIMINSNFLSLPDLWIDRLCTWIHIFIATPLSENKLSLNKIKEKEHKKELKFIIPIKKYINVDVLNSIVKKFDPISKKCPDIVFKNIAGILTGYIDLVVFWKKKYYIIDYKSNWLGPDHSYYCKNSIKKEIIKYRYDLQYQIYSLAIHRYLKKKIMNYSYQKDFGGIFYLFLRAFDDINHSGIFFIKPNYNLIFNLDKLIRGQFYDDKK